MMTAVAPRIESPPTRVLAVTSGKGGVGKSTVSINLAIALAGRGQRVTLLDADLGLANVDVLLGLTPARTLQHVIAGECGLDEVLLDGPAGIRVIPASSGVSHMAELSLHERAGLIRAFDELDVGIDWLVVDTAAGIAANSLHFCEAAQEVLVVVCDDPASITDAYATIKVLHQRCGRRRFRVVVNMAQNESQALLLFRRLQTATDRFLDVVLELAGSIPFDRHVQGAARRRVPAVMAYPDGAAARAFKKLAQSADTWPRPQGANGQFEFFLERLIQADLTGRQALA
jgi:flagellar biosynthesis protein FlhG